MGNLLAYGANVIGNVSGESGGGGLLPRFYIYSDTGSTVTATKGTTVITATETSTEGLFTCDIPDYGEWTVTGVISGSTKQTTVNVTINKEYNVAFIDGATVTPTDDISILLQCADIYDAEEIETISDLLADTTTLQAVISSENAIDYLVRSTTWTNAITADQTAMSYIGLNNYASNTLLGDSTWCNAICNNLYFESVLNVKVPVMTSNTTPSGYVASAKTEGSTARQAYCAFDGDDDTRYVSGYASGGNEWLQIEFPSAVKIYYISGIITEGTSQGIKFVIQYYNGTNWINIEGTDTTVSGQVTDNETYVISSTTSLKFRVYASQNTVSNYRLVANNLQFYGREDV